MDVIELKQLYQRTFGSPAGAAVLVNLMGALFADSSTWDADQRQHAYNEGRRSVWLHINKMLEYTPAEIANMYRGVPIVKVGANELV